jgi:hypothetical protein
LAFVAALLFWLAAFPFFLAISVSLPMMIPLDGTGQKCEYSDPRHAWPDPSMRDLGEGRLVNWIFALPIALAIGLVLVHVLAGGEVAWFLDQLVVAGILAFGIVKAFFA